MYRNMFKRLTRKQPLHSVSYETWSAHYLMLGSFVRFIFLLHILGRTAKLTTLRRLLFRLVIWKTKTIMPVVTIN